MLAEAVEIHRPEMAQRRRRPVVGEAVRAVAVGGGRRSVDEGRLVGRTPLEQPQRKPEVGAKNEVAVGRGGVGDRADVDDGVELAAVEPGEQVLGRHHVGELALRQIAPFAVRTEDIVDDDVAAAGLVEARHDVRADEPGPAGDQQHPNPPRRILRPSFARERPPVQLAPIEAVNAGQAWDFAWRRAGQGFAGGLTAYRQTRIGPVPERMNLDANEK